MPAIHLLPMWNYLQTYTDIVQKVQTIEKQFKLGINVENKNNNNENNSVLLIQGNAMGLNLYIFPTISIERDNFKVVEIH